jgi:hypothetical protein
MPKIIHDHFLPHPLQTIIHIVKSEVFTTVILKNALLGCGAV